MKKLLLSSTLFFYCLGTFAQLSGNPKTKLPARIVSSSKTALRPHKRIDKISAPGNDAVQVNTNSVRRLPSQVNPRRQPAIPGVQSIIATENVIGSTTYDLQTNGTIANRITNNGDGTLSAVWTMSQDPDPNGSYPDRGTGYNYYNGFVWGTAPSSRIEPFRTGWANIAYVSGGHEATLAHDFTGTNGETFTSRPNKGTGSWATTSIPGTSNTDVWPRLVAGGANGQSFHAIWQGTGSASGPLYYSRSTNNGSTWTTPGEIPQYMQGTDYFGIGADAYSIDVRGDVIAIAAGELAQDLVLLKSTDNGVTWTKTIIAAFAGGSLYDSGTMNTDTDNDGTPDTLSTNASDATVVLDNSNIAHVFFGRTRIFEASGATNISGFNIQEIDYWNENMGADNYQFLAGPPDLNNDGVISLPVGCGNDPANDPIGYYGSGFREFIGMPSAGVDANNNIFVVYQAVDELSDTSIYNEAFVHPYILKSCDGGVHWTDPDSAYDVVLATQGTAGEAYDGAYASMAKHLGSQVELVYQRDFAPGTTLSGLTTCEGGNNNGSFNDIVHVEISGNDVHCRPVAVQNLPAISSFSVSANYPNPFHGKTSFEINLRKAADVTVEVSDLLGRVLSVDHYNFNSGTHQVAIDATGFAAGVYTYKVIAGSNAVTKKLIVQ